MKLIIENTSESNPSWSDVKLKLADFDHSRILGLAQDLYEVGKVNQAILHARLNLGRDTLKPYKTTIARSLRPDMFKNQEIESDPSWSDVKVKLAYFDCDRILVLVQDLYAVSKINQAVLHARLNLGGDTVKPYKTIIARWLWPDIFKNQDTSTAKAEKAIVDYKKAIGQTEGLAELTTFYCEQAAGYSNEVNLRDENYFTALVSMYERALQISTNLPVEQRDLLLKRLDRVRCHSHDIGYGVGFKLDELLFDYRIAA